MKLSRKHKNVSSASNPKRRISCSSNIAFQCPVCRNLSVHSTEKDIYRLADVDHEELFVCDECGSEMFAKLGADGSIKFDVHTAPEGTDWDAINSASESQKTGEQWIKDRLEKAAVEYLTNRGFDAEDIAWMLYIDVNKTDTEMRFEVRSELSYKGMRALAAVLDPIVQEYDPDAYFDDVDSGIIEAYVRNLGAVTSASEAVEQPAVNMIITVGSGINADGFEVSIVDAAGDQLFKSSYMYGYNASYDKKFADWAQKDYDNAIKNGHHNKPALKPYVSDIINALCEEYSVTDIEVVPGKNIYKGNNVEGDKIEEFKSKYLSDIVLSATDIPDEDREAVIEFAHDCYELGRPVEDYNEFASILRDEGISPTRELYQLYLDNYNDSSIEGASYGGAFDVEDNQYFTRDDINSLAYTVVDHLNEMYNFTFDVSDVYMDEDGNNILTVEVLLKESDEVFYATMAIDLRKVKNPSRLADVYALQFVSQLSGTIEDESCMFDEGIESATSVDPIPNGCHSRWEITDTIGVHNYGGVYHVFDRSDGNRYLFNTESLDELNAYLESNYDTVIVDPDPKSRPVEEPKKRYPLYLWSAIENAVANMSNIPEEHKDEFISLVGDRATNKKVPRHGWKSATLPKAVINKYPELDFHGRDNYNSFLPLTDNETNSVGLTLEDALSEIYEAMKGRWFRDSIVNSTTSSSRSVQGGSIFDPPDPPEEEPLEELDADDEVIELSLDDVVVIVDDEGHWEYEDENYPWASPSGQFLNVTDEDWYSEEVDGLYIRDAGGVVEDTDELLESHMPGNAGKYVMKGSATLVYEVSGVDYEREYHQEHDGEVGYETHFYTDDAEVKFSRNKSSVEVEFVKI